jgi:redox-sensitive bicupin YhaK (pirin superfamily)
MRNIARVVRGQAASDGAGVRLNRVIGGPELPQLDPFLLLTNSAPTMPPITWPAFRSIRTGGSRP